MLNLNKYGFLSFPINEGILKIPGNKFIIIGVIKEIPKLDATSIRRCICVFLYTAQKHPKNIQKKNNKM